MSGGPRDDLTLVIGQGQDADNRALGDVLRRRRTDLKRRTEEVAQAVGVTASYIRLIERGERAPAPDKAEQLLLELELPLERTHQGDLRFSVEGRHLVLSFKHWAPPDPARGGPVSGFGAVTESMAPLQALAFPTLGAAMGISSGWSQLRAFRQRRSASTENASDEALMGAIIQRIARMPRNELEDVAAAVESIHAEHTARRAAPADSSPRGDKGEDGVEGDAVEDAEIENR